MGVKSQARTKLWAIPADFFYIWVCRSVGQEGLAVAPQMCCLWQRPPDTTHHPTYSQLLVTHTHFPPSFAAPLFL